MRSLSSRKWIMSKGFLFLALGISSAAYLLFDHPTIKVLLLLTLTIWCFCRFYYFAFYVIQHWVDPNYRFTGLLSIVRYLLRTHQSHPPDPPLLGSRE